MKWRDIFLSVGVAFIGANLLHATVRLLFRENVPDDLLTLTGQLLSWPSLLGLVSIGGGREVIQKILELSWGRGPALSGDSRASSLPHGGQGNSARSLLPDGGAG